MALEVEAKIKVDSHLVVRNRLEQLGAVFVGAVLECNRLFDKPSGVLRRKGRGLRIRSCRALIGQTPAATLTYKGPKQPGPIKTRKELETVVQSPKAAKAILRALGFTEVLRFEKRRETWQFDGCTIELDEVPHLGCFVEIEGEDQLHVQRVQNALEMGHMETIKTSYIGLLLRHCQEHGLPADRILFEHAGS